MEERLKLIIVDDEAFMRENLSRLFPWEELGYTVCAVCADGEEALRALREHQADVVLTDIQMPAMNGIELARAIRGQRIPAEIVFLSAYSDFEYARQGILYSVFDYLVKPIRYQELSALFLRLRKDILSSRQTFGQPLSEDEQLIKRISEHIQTNPAFSTLDSCADALKMSADCISDLVKKQCSMTFTEFVYQEKMILAGELLHNIGLQINMISDMLGYTNAKNFSRAFHSYYHMTPMEYRKQGQTSVR